MKVLRLTNQTQLLHHLCASPRRHRVHAYPPLDHRCVDIPGQQLPRLDHFLEPCIRWGGGQSGCGKVGGHGWKVWGRRRVDVAAEPLLGATCKTEPTALSGHGGWGGMERGRKVVCGLADART
eukprot:365876-Chlamydomonas_euryale.AAC.8